MGSPVAGDRAPLPAFKQTDPFFTYTDQYVRESYGRLMFDNANQWRIAMPPEWLLLNRLQWGLNAVLAKLNATGPWPSWFRRAVEGGFREDTSRAQAVAAP